MVITDMYKKSFAVLEKNRIHYHIKNDTINDYVKSGYDSSIISPQRLAASNDEWSNRER